MTADRIPGLDALRGLAALLMLEQHLGFWLWDMGGKNAQIDRLLADHPLMVGINGLGGLAAPLFIALAGAGSVFIYRRHGSAPAVLLKRGLAVFFCGYVLNLLARDWFTMGSWYVLHLIGFCLAIAPLLHRFGSRTLAVVLAAALLATAVLAEYLRTPLFMADRFMSDCTRAGGVIRLASVEGHFPVFPWIFLFITGIIAGRWIESDRARPLVVLGLCFLFSGAALLSIGHFAHPLMAGTPIRRAFLPSITFYPALPPMVLLLASVTLFLTAFVLRFGRIFMHSTGRPLVCLGRSSLTILIIHIAILSGLSRPLGFWRSLGTGAAAAITIASLAIAALLATLWGRVHYRYGAEWLIRKIAG